MRKPHNPLRAVIRAHAISSKLNPTAIVHVFDSRGQWVGLVSECTFRGRSTDRNFMGRVVSLLVDGKPRGKAHRHRILTSLSKLGEV
jgi:hypothetical protein